LGKGQGETVARPEEIGKIFITGRCVTFIIDFFAAKQYIRVGKEEVMIDMFVSLLVVLLLFGLCEIEERAMESQRNYWLKYHRLLGGIGWGWSY
jgi:hypothetical protein